MRINVNTEKKRVEVWLTRAEANDTDVRAKLNSVNKQYKEKRYIVAVFISGPYDLTDQTAMLLKTNMKCLRHHR